MTFPLKVNGTDVSVDVPADTPLLWVIREELKLTGTKFGCGVGLCGACVVHIDGKSAAHEPVSALASGERFYCNVNMRDGLQR